MVPGNVKTLAFARGPQERDFLQLISNKFCFRKRIIKGKSITKTCTFMNLHCNCFTKSPLNQPHLCLNEQLVLSLMEKGLCTDKLEPHSPNKHDDTKNSSWFISLPGKANQKGKEATTAPETGKVSSPSAKIFCHTF